MPRKLMRERPGFETPWREINEMLSLEERFEVNDLKGKRILLAPKHSSQLAALLYFLQQENISFQVEGEQILKKEAMLIISFRFFSEMIFHQEGIVEVGAGCQLSHLRQFLHEKGQEVPLEVNPLIFRSLSIGEFILFGQATKLLTGILLGIELVTWEGDQIFLSSTCLMSPSLHKLLWGIGSFPGILLKVILKTYPIPETRLHLAWSFREKEVLWNHFQALKKFSSTWDSLEVMLSFGDRDKGFVFAQISGLKGEMELFSKRCPDYALQQGEKRQVEKFLYEQNLNCYLVSRNYSLKPQEYLFLQDWNKKAWLLTKEEIPQPCQSDLLWKQFFFNAMRG